jgi:hypothetical protein
MFYPQVLVFLCRNIQELSESRRRLVMDNLRSHYQLPILTTSGFPASPLQSTLEYTSVFRPPRVITVT